MEADLPAGFDEKKKKKTITYRISRDSKKSLIPKNLFFFFFFCGCEQIFMGCSGWILWVVVVVSAAGGGGCSGSF